MLEYELYELILMVSKSQKDDLQLDKQLVDIGIDSIGLIKLFLLIEEKADIHISDESIITNQLNTIGDILNLINGV
ncbi:MAG: hypothetical protein A2Y40_06625 [Candidatus Margulisbacteria bacterium GWF2_35_9]|nr:MAG: hypothetical protein A2Y40_06625 [Candidatus Margulisbacteria bacterium GWF2_35_9]